MNFYKNFLMAEVFIMFSLFHIKYLIKTKFKDVKEIKK